MRSMGGFAPHSSVDYDGAAWFVTILGIAFGAAGLRQVYVDPEPIAVQSIEGALVVGPVLVLLTAGYRIGRRGIDDETRWSIATWAVLGSLTAGALVAGYLYTEWLVRNTVADASLLFVVGAASGGAVGALAAANRRSSPDANRAATESKPEPEPEPEGDIEPNVPPTNASPSASLGADSRSRYALHATVLADGPLEVETLASQVASLEGTSEPVVYLDLVHVRLPKLARSGRLEYDPVSGVVMAETADPVD